MDYFKRVRLTPAEKITKLQQVNPHRMGLEEISLLMALGTGLSKRQSRETLEAFLQLILNALREGREVMLTGFGGFKPVQKPARRVRNPRVAAGPDAFKEVGESTVFRFKPGSEMKPIFSHAPGKKPSVEFPRLIPEEGEAQVIRVTPSEGALHELVEARRSKQALISAIQKALREA